jgi:hypothetical protein
LGGANAAVSDSAPRPFTTFVLLSINLTPGITHQPRNFQRPPHPFTYRSDIFSSPSLPGTVFKHSTNHNPQDPSSAPLYTILLPGFS